MEAELPVLVSLHRYIKKSELEEIVSKMLGVTEEEDTRQIQLRDGSLVLLLIQHINLEAINCIHNTKGL